MEQQEEQEQEQQAEFGDSEFQL